MVEIKPLRRLEAVDIRRLNYGYTSNEVYQVSKLETLASTSLHLVRVALGQPYVKRWETDDAELALLQQTVTAGFSLGAYTDQEMIGVAIGEPRRWNRSLWVWELHVLPAHQRQGIGSRLVQALISKARQANLRILVCETQNTNVPAIDFYRKMGFEIDGVDLSYYTNQDIQSGEVAFFMKYKIEQVRYG